VTNFADPPAWVSDAVFYQIFPDRFALSERVQKPGPLEPWDTRPTTYGFKGGDLLGIVEHLDYIESLGVNALYLNPIFASASNHRYHTYDYYSIDPLLGGDAAFRELLDACHARGIRVVLDGVFNHSGRGFWPFHHILEAGAESPYIDWFFIDRTALASGRQLRPYPGPRDSGRLGYEAWWGLPALPKLNVANPHLREHLMGAVEHWLKFGIDGWRLDVAEEIEPGFWREFRKRVRAINPDAYIVAEIWREKPEWVRGDTFDALMNYPLTEALLSFTAARTLDTGMVSRHNEYRDTVRPVGAVEFAQYLDLLMKVYRPETVRAELNLLGSHDTPRFLSLANGDVEALRLSLLAVMTLPGAPCIYYGDEVGMTGGLDPDNRGAFPWDESRWNRHLLDLVRVLSSFRAGHHVLRHGDFRVVAADGDAVAYAMTNSGGGALVALNAGSGAARLALPGTFDGLAAVDLPGWEAPRIVRDGGKATLDIQPRSGGVLVTQGAAS
jgi:cyclomaltodextrinase / maltogenic alpha-amylase / neopullulanase